MTSTGYRQWVLHVMRAVVGMRIERRTHEQLKEHYEIEKELATRLRASSRHERSRLYASLYDELYQRVPLHPLLTQKVSSPTLSPQLRFIRRFLRKDTVFLEIGPGDCALSLAVARIVKKVYALEVSAEITKSLPSPQNFELILFDGCDMPLAAQSVTVAYSDQVVEHLHPDDIVEHLKDVHRALVSRGMYMCITPHRLSGPHDISMYFDTVASGFHLKEYTYTELSSLFKQVGFSHVRAYVGALGIYMRFPVFLLRFLESLLGSLPHPLSKAIACVSLLSVRLAGIK